MTDIRLDLSALDMNSIIVRKTKQLSSNNLFNNLQRSHTMSSTTPLSIITLSSFSNFEEKLIQMATKKKFNLLSNVPIEFSTAQIRSRIPTSNRSNGSTLTRSSLNYPTTLTRTTTPYRPNNRQLSDRSLHIFNSPMSSRRMVSARTPNNNLNRAPQQQQQPILSRSNSQYGHFLAYLRRQSLARTRRKQEEEELGNNDTTITLNLNKTSSPQQLYPTSNYSLASLTTDTQSTPIIAIAAKRTGRPLTTSRQPHHSTPNHRLNPSPQSRPASPKNSNNDTLATLTSSLLITPTNSIVDESSVLPIKAPYEVHLTDDRLNYCYVSDDSGVKYQGQMLSIPV